MNEVGGAGGAVSPAPRRQRQLQPWPAALAGSSSSGCARAEQVPHLMGLQLGSAVVLADQLEAGLLALLAAVGAGGPLAVGQRLPGAAAVDADVALEVGQVLQAHHLADQVPGAGERRAGGQQLVDDPAVQQQAAGISVSRPAQAEASGPSRARPGVLPGGKASGREGKRARARASLEQLVERGVAHAVLLLPV